MKESYTEKELLRLETERQAVLGELSFIERKHPRYEELDRRFVQLTNEINQLKK